MADGEIVHSLRHETRAEAANILRWWQSHMVDTVNGGFHGEIDPAGQVVADAPKSVVINARMLWFFSAMATHIDDVDARALAQRAADYIRAHFVDREHGGLYWLLDVKGNVIDGKKQTYAQAFGVYAFAEHYRATGDISSLDLARRLQGEIEARLQDHGQGGYIEALSVDWGDVGDQRLSDKDIDAPKTMNTHLHVLEAYTLLHRVAPDADSRAALARILALFADRFVDAQSHHLHLFYDMDWHDRSHAVSFGHDIEASWLMWEAAEILGDDVLSARVRPLVLGLAEVTLAEGLNSRGDVAYERDFDGHLDTAGEWWGQAEALVGFVNAWRLSGDPKFLSAAQRLWSHLKAHYGAGGGDEWSWYADDAGRAAQVMAGQWKCPYHNGRAMIELDNRLKT